MGNWFVIVALLGALWALQMYLAYRQAQAFMAGVKQLRAAGPTAIGVSSVSRMRRRTYVALAAVDDEVVEAISMAGLTVWARPRPADVLRGSRLQHLADEQEARDRLTRAAAMAARSLLRRMTDDDDPNGVRIEEVSGIG